MGQAADLILEGIVCKDCGEFIDGDSPGFPRSCCIGSSRSELKNTEKTIKQKNRESNKKLLKEVLSKHEGLSVKTFTPYHFRVIYMRRTDKILDIYPTRNRYHNIVTDERGSFKNIKNFIEAEFGL